MIVPWSKTSKPRVLGAASAEKIAKIFVRQPLPERNVGESQLESRVKRIDSRIVCLSLKLPRG